MQMIDNNQPNANWTKETLNRYLSAATEVMSDWSIASSRNDTKWSNKRKKSKRKKSAACENCYGCEDNSYETCYTYL